MGSKEVEGRSIEDATNRALRDLGVAREEAEIVILDEGSKGLFGLLGGRPARVRVTALRAEEGRIKELVQGLFERMKIGAQVDVALEEGTFQIRIDTMGADGLLIGRKGDTLNAMQHLIDRMVNRGLTERMRVSVDVGGYRERRAESLRTRALTLAGQVKSTRRERSTDPMQANDRRIIHVVLADDPGIRTYTVGEGTYRSVVIAPAESRVPQGAGESDSRRPPRRQPAFAAKESSVSGDSLDA
jgi:spoIIIJ-associated protein